MKDIIAKNQGRVRAIIKKLTGSYNEDLEQEIYIKTWKNKDHYKEEGKFAQWLGALAANVCRDYFKSAQSQMETRQVNSAEVLENIRVGGNQEEIVDRKKRQKIILKAVDELPRKMREVIILYEFEDMSCEQIAQKTGVPEGTVKSRLFNARKILSEKLQFLRGEQK